MDEKQRNRVLLVLFMGVLMGALDIAIVGPALPAIQTEYGVDTRGLAWIFNIYVLFALIGTPLMAKLSDRFGRRGIYILAISLFGAGSILIAAAADYRLLLVGRAIQATGAGGIFPVAAAVIGDTFPQDKRGSALGLVGAVFGLAFLIGPLLAGVLLRYASWHWLFLINIPIAILLAAAAARLLPSTRAANPRGFDVAGMLLLSTLLAALAFAITGLDPGRSLLGLTTPAIGGALLAALVLLPVFWSVEKRAADPMVAPALLRSKQMRIAGLLAIGTGVTESGTVFVPALAVAGLGMTEYQASFWMMPAVIAMMVGSPLAGRLLDRMGSQIVVQAGLLLTTLGILIFGLAGAVFTWFVVAQVLAGLGLAALLGAPLRYVVLNEAAPDQRGAAQGLLTVVLSVGQLLGAAIVGAIAASRGSTAHGYQQAFLVVSGIMALTFLVGFGLKSRAAEKLAAGAAVS
jgi:EmrB/QacA subfamily drug resistance transporter